MNFDLPITVDVGGKEYAIRNKCDYRVCLDCIDIGNNPDMRDDDKIQCSLFVFYEDVSSIPPECLETAAEKMMYILGGGESGDRNEQKTRLMDWEHDFNLIAPPLNKVAGYDVRTPGLYVHWYTFLGFYMEIDGNSTYGRVVGIRSKMAKGQKLDKMDLEFYRDHKKQIDLPVRASQAELDELNGAW